MVSATVDYATIQSGPTIRALALSAPPNGDDIEYPAPSLRTLCEREWRVAQAARVRCSHVSWLRYSLHRPREHGGCRGGHERALWLDTNRKRTRAVGVFYRLHGVHVHRGIDRDPFRRKAGCPRSRHYVVNVYAPDAAGR